MRAAPWALILLGCGGAPDGEQPQCRDPHAVDFYISRSVTSCDDFTRPDLGACEQHRGVFDTESCTLETEYYCSGIHSTAFLVLSADAPFFGTETHIRIQDGCRLQIDLTEL